VKSLRETDVSPVSRNYEKEKHDAFVAATAYTTFSLFHASWRA
jgi:hypothetical protein